MYFITQGLVQEARCLHFDILGIHFGPSGVPWDAILAPRDHPGRPWEQQDGLEMVVYSILFDLGVILGPVFISFLSSRSLKFHCCFRACFQVIFLSLSESKFRFGTSKSWFSHWRYCKNRLFVEIVFKEFRNRIWVFFWCLEIRFSDFLGLENKLENETIFDEIPNPIFWIWCRRSGSFWAL